MFIITLWSILFLFQLEVRERHRFNLESSIVKRSEEMVEKPGQSNGFFLTNANFSLVINVRRLQMKYKYITKIVFRLIHTDVNAGTIYPSMDVKSASLGLPKL